MSIVKWRPGWQSSLPDLRDEMNRLFDWTLPAGDVLSDQGSWRPQIDVYGEKGNIVVKADLPGLTKDDIDLEVEDNVLTLKGAKKHEEEVDEADFYRCERSYGSFQRTFQLPAGVDSTKVKAVFKDGVLKVTLPQTEHAKSRKIEVSMN